MCEREVGEQQHGGDIPWVWNTAGTRIGLGRARRRKRSGDGSKDKDGKKESKRWHCIGDHEKKQRGPPRCTEVQ